MSDTTRNSNVRPQYDFGAMPRALAMQLKGNGFRIDETGGGCTAWRKDNDDASGYTLITDDASHILDRGEADIGIYNSDGDCILCVSGQFTTPDLPELVRDHITDMPFSAALPDDIMDLRANCSLGESIIRLCNNATHVAAQIGEHELQEQVTAAVVRQCEVWLHG